MQNLKLCLGFMILISVPIGYRLLFAKSEITEALSVTLAQQDCHADNAPIFGIRFSSDGQYVVGNLGPKSIRVWNAKTGAIVATLTDDVVDWDRKFSLSTDN